MKLLYIIASPRGNQSRSKAISTELLSSLKEKHPALLIRELNLFEMNLPEVVGGSLEARYALLSGGKPDESVLAAWNEITKYSKEFADADLYLISSPMWNFSIPYKLKQYIDIIMQPGILFSFTENGVVGLTKNKKMFCVTSRGNDYSKGSVMHPFDFQEPYLRAIFGFAGITDISFINAQPMDINPGITRTQLRNAITEAGSMASTVEFK